MDHGPEASRSRYDIDYHYQLGYEICMHEQKNLEHNSACGVDGSDARKAGEAIFTALRGLGPARIIVRNALGATEVFADLAALRVEGGWVHLVHPVVHLHLNCSDIDVARFRPSLSCQEGAPVISFVGQDGQPSVVVVFDRLKGAAAESQAREFHQLAALYRDDETSPSSVRHAPLPTMH